MQPYIFIIYSVTPDGTIDIETAYTSRKRMLKALHHLKIAHPSFEFKFKRLLLNGPLSNDRESNCFIFSKEECL